MIELLDRAKLKRAQALVARRHYLRRPVDVRCSPLAYDIGVAPRALWGGEPEQTGGVLIFGRPQATRCRDFYGSVEDVQRGKCEVTRWQVLNLARVYIYPECQFGGPLYDARVLPGFVDRKGRWQSTLASTAINEALDRLVLDYLLTHPPCFPEEPWELAYCISYCATQLGTEEHSTGRRASSCVASTSGPIGRLCSLIERGCGHSLRASARWCYRHQSSRRGAGGTGWRGR